MTYPRSEWRILWRIDPFLGKDHETNIETTAVAGQRCGKQTPITTVTVFLCLISYAPHQENVWGSDCIDPPFLTSYEMEMSFQPHAPAILLKGSKQHGRPLVKYKTIYTHTHLVTCIRQTQKMEAKNISETWETSPTKTRYNPRINIRSLLYHY